MKQMWDWPDEAGMFLHNLQERLDIGIGPLQVNLGTGIEITEGLPGKLLNTLELSVSTKAQSS